MFAVLQVVHVGAPVVAAWGIAVWTRHRVNRLGARFAVIAALTALFAFVIPAALTGFFPDASGDDIAGWAAVSVLAGAFTGLLSTCPWRGGIASRRADGATAQPHSQLLPVWGFVVVSVGAAASAGWLVVVVFFAVVAVPQWSATETEWFSPDIVWFAILGVVGSAVVGAPFVAAATALGYVSLSFRTLAARAVVIAGGVTIISLLLVVPLAAWSEVPRAAVVSVLGVCAAIGLALAGGALGPWRYGFAAPRRATEPDTVRAMTRGRTPKGTAPLSLWSDASDWND